MTRSIEEYIAGKAGLKSRGQVKARKGRGKDKNKGRGLAQEEDTTA
jgi:hypothetical protein